MYLYIIVARTTRNLLGRVLISGQHFNAFGSQNRMHLVSRNAFRVASESPMIFAGVIWTGNYKWKKFVEDFEFLHELCGCIQLLSWRFRQICKLQIFLLVRTF